MSQSNFSSLICLRSDIVSGILPCRTLRRGSIGYLLSFTNCLNSSRAARSSPGRLFSRFQVVSFQASTRLFASTVPIRTARRSSEQPAADNRQINSRVLMALWFYFARNAPDWLSLCFSGLLNLLNQHRHSGQDRKGYHKKIPPEPIRCGTN